MTKKEFLSASLPYRLKCKTKLSKGIKSIVGGSFGAAILFRVAPSGGQRDFTLLASDIIPIVRHINDLTKECVQADYNNGEPFTPIDDLNEMFSFDSDRLVHYMNSGLGWWIAPFFTSRAVGFDMMLKPIQQLLKWHFDLITEECERVYVTEDFNPYK